MNVNISTALMTAMFSLELIALDVAAWLPTSRLLEMIKKRQLKKEATATLAVRLYFGTAVL